MGPPRHLHRSTAILAATLLAAGCGASDDAADDDPSADRPAADDAATDAPAAALSDDLFIRDGSGTVVVALPDGRTESRDVACSVYRDRFESTIEYSDILESEQSITFYYREADDGSTLQFTFQDPRLGGLTAGAADAISNAAFDGSGGFSADLEPLVVGNPDPTFVEISISGTCA
jgi:hypothetical protein